MILFVDDEKSLVRLYEEWLEHSGFETVGMTNALDALELFREQPDRFDLVITDLTMPGISGVELAEELQHLVPRVPIVLCTGFSETVIPEEMAEVGICKVLTKPVSFDRLMYTIQDILGVKAVDEI